MPLGRAPLPKIDRVTIRRMQLEDWRRNAFTQASEQGWRSRTIQLLDRFGTILHFRSGADRVDETQGRHLDRHSAALGLEIGSLVQPNAAATVWITELREIPNAEGDRSIPRCMTEMIFLLPPSNHASLIAWERETRPRH